MDAGSWLLTLTLLAAGQAPSDVFFSNQRNYRIPIDIQPALKQEIRELLLFASSDKGKIWQQVAVAPPDRDAFVFYAPTDGEYWFKVGAVNRQGKQEPENIYQGPPQQKMVVDTLKPLLRIVIAQRQGDEVLVGWELQEEHPDWSGFKLEYQDRTSPGVLWTPAQANPVMQGQARFRPPSMGPLTVRLQVRDRAGNLAFATAEVQGSAGVTPVAFKDGPSPLQGSMGLTSPPASPAKPQLTSDAPKQAIAPPPAPWAPPKANISENPTYSSPPPSSPQEPNPKLVASTDMTPIAAPAGVPQRAGLPSVQYVNSPEVNMEYDISKVGPSGIASVELWMTQNDGQTWERYAWDPEVKGIRGVGRQQRLIELPGDGVYGFILVVKSRAGIGKTAPRPGDTPEMRIEVDTVPPAAQMYSPVPEGQRPNTLILSWNAKDNNLAPTPITLDWAERRDGPWQPIAAGLPNTGRHAWTLPDSLPVQVYLRLRVRDLAGNESIAVTSEPQVVDLTEPEGRLLGVSVLPRRP